MTVRTRLWESPNGSSTWLHSNLGWLPISNTPADELTAEQFAEQTAAGYGLVESTKERANQMAGV